MDKASMITVSKVFSSVPPLFSKLASVLSGDIDCSHLAITSHSYDGSPYSIRPQAVIYPKTSSDIKHTIAFAREYGIPLTACGGQTAASGGSLGEGIILDCTRYFSKIRHVNMLEHTVTVDAGVTIDELIASLDAWNVQVPVLQKEDGKATVGGLVATKSATVSSFYAGTIREWVEGLTVIVDSGEEHTIKDGITPSGRLLGIYQSVFPLLVENGPILRASRRENSDDATGYSVWNTSIGPRQLLDQLVGSEGTLAIITSVTLRVVPKEFHTSFLIPVPSEALLETYTDIARHHKATALFMFDSTFRNLAEKFRPHVLPTETQQSPFYLIATWSATDAHTAHDMGKSCIVAIPGGDGVCEISEKARETLSTHSFLTSLFSRYSGGTHMLATAANGIIVPFHYYGQALRELDTFMGTTGLPYALTGYPGSGHIALHASFDAQSTHYEDDLATFRKHIFKIVASYGGGISAIGGDGLEKTTALSLVFNEATMNVFKKLKAAWDPSAIFNPSKKISLQSDYLTKHVARTFL